MSNALLISFKTLTETSEIPNNIDPNMLRPIIREVQDMRIEPLIGTRLYKALLKKVNDQTVGGDYKTLLDDYIRPVMTYGVLAELPVRMGFRPTNQGFVAKTSENSTNNSNEDLYRIARHYESIREFYGNKLSAYLCENEAKFPEYKAETETDEVRPGNSTYQTGIFLGRSKPRIISQREWDNKDFEVH